MFKRLWRFRLRGLLILVTIVACLAGWYSWATRLHSKEVAVLNSLDQQLHGYIYYSYDDDPGPWCGTSMGGFATFEWHGPPGLMKSVLVAWEDKAFYRLTNLTIYCTNWGALEPLDDEIIEQLASLKSLNRLEVGDDDLTKSALHRLQQSLPHTKIVVKHAPEFDELIRYRDILRYERQGETPTLADRPVTDETTSSAEEDEQFDFQQGD